MDEETLPTMRTTQESMGILSVRDKCRLRLHGVPKHIRSCLTLSEYRETFSGWLYS
ncbi:hypothetical protein V6A89_004327 [Enterobacter hormaechei]